MKLQALTPMLTTWDLAASLDFYISVLGFRCERKDLDRGWAALSLDAVEIMLSTPNQHMGHQGPLMTGSLYIRTTDVDACWSKFKDRARICYPIETFDYGMREFAIFDNNGYLLQFGQEMRDAERRHRIC